MEDGDAGDVQRPQMIADLLLIVPVEMRGGLVEK
jgi:hypothetical protein